MEKNVQLALFIISFKGSPFFVKHCAEMEDATSNGLHFKYREREGGKNSV